MLSRLVAEIGDRSSVGSSRRVAATAPPTSNTGVGSDPSQADPGLYGWDWSATTHDPAASALNVREAVTDLVSALGGTVHLPGKGLHGWAQSVEVYDGGGFALGRVYFGGGREDVHVVSTSAAADRVRPLVVGRHQAKTARVDTRVDSLTPFADLVGVCEQAAETYGTRITEISSRERGASLGRTVYLGAPTSAVRVRVYEKWLESPGQFVEGTNRVEVQLRPASVAKQRVSSWRPAETFCASRVTQDLAGRLGTEVAPSASLHVSRGTPDLERCLAAMGRQYGRAVDQHLKLTGGDMATVIDYLTTRSVSL